MSTEDSIKNSSSVPDSNFADRFANTLACISGCSFALHKDTHWQMQFKSVTFLESKIPFEEEAQYSLLSRQTRIICRFFKCTL